MKKAALVVCCVLLLAACKNDENSIGVTDAPVLPVVVFRGPSTNSTHIEAQNVKAAINDFNYFTTSFLAFEGASLSSSGSTYTWTFRDGDLAFRLTGTKQENNTVSWKLYLDGRGSNGMQYSNWLATEGTADADLKNASWVNYEENASTKSSEVVWSVSSSGTLTAALRLFSHGALTARTVISENLNNTGEVQKYTGNALSYRAVWLASGSGQFWYFDTNGQITSQGSWS